MWVPQPILSTSVWNESTVIVALVTTIGAVIVALIQKFKRFPELKRMRKWKVGYTDIHETYENLGDIVAATDAQRAIIVKIENGGGIPKAGHPLYLSVLYEIVQGGTRPNREDWVKREIMEPHYFKFLSTLLQDQAHTLITSEMPEDCLLRTAYEGYGVHHAETFLLRQSKHATYVLSVHYGSEEQLEADEKTILGAKASNIRNIFRK